MKTTFVVKELQKNERDKLDEKKIIYKAILENVDEEQTLILTSGRPINLLKKDEVLFDKIAFQKKLVKEK